MTSILKVDSIQNAAGTAAMTIDSSGNLITPNQSVFRVSLNNHQTISNNTNTLVAFDTVTFDPNSWWNNTTKQFLPTIAGYYCSQVSLRWNSSDDWDIADVYFYKNNDIMQAASLRNERFETIVLTSLVYLNGSGDYLKVNAQQNSGSDKQIRGTSTGADTNFSSFKVLG